MTGQPQHYASDDACLRARIGLVALRLSIEVNRMRALRGDGREDRFAGVLMRDSDIAALCAGLIADPLPDTETLFEQFAEAEAHHAELCKALPQQPLVERLAPLYGLTPAETQVLFICLAVAIDPRLGRVLAYLQEDMSRPYLTMGLAQRLLASLPGGDLSALWSGLSDEGALIRYGLLERREGVVSDAALRVPDWLVRLILVGPDAMDRMDQLPLPLVSPATADGPLLIEADTAIDALITLGPIGPIWLSQQGSLSCIRKVGVIAGVFGHRQVISEADALPADQRAALVCSLGRHSILITQRPALWSGFGRTVQMVRAVPSTQDGRLSFWQEVVVPGLNRPDLAPLLAEEYSTPLSRLWRLAQEARDVATLEALLRHDRSEPMQGLADRILPRFSFDDLELPARSLARLRGFAARRKSESTVLEDWGLGTALGAGRGSIALFLGPSGTGKTMAASVMAQEAGLDLWRINLATTVSKYIGETEANLDRIFHAADKAEVMLFFDEAEALFSKRAEVKEARDRYANMEMAYLLQRIEDFRGIAVLASNMGTSLEPAMLRRFDLVLELTLPDAATRRRLWSRIETSRVPLARDVDLDLLAERFELAGGDIRQAILSAAHEAVDEGQVTQMHLLRAVAREYVKLGRPLRKEDFGSSFAQMRGQP